MVLEMPSVQEEFIWSNNSIGDLIWLQTCPEARLEFYFGGSSYHAYMAIVISQVVKGRKSFRLFKSWSNDPDFMSLSRAHLSRQQALSVANLQCSVLPP